MQRVTSNLIFTPLLYWLSVTRDSGFEVIIAVDVDELSFLKVGYLLYWVVCNEELFYAGGSQTYSSFRYGKLATLWGCNSSLGRCLENHINVGQLAVSSFTSLEIPGQNKFSFAFRRLFIAPIVGVWVDTSVDEDYRGLRGGVLCKWPSLIFQYSFKSWGIRLWSTIMHNIF